MPPEMITIVAPIAMMAKKLASKMPKGLDVTYFTNSGSEAA